jgi:hypothetical protein
MKKLLDLISNLTNKTCVQFLLFSGIIWLIFVHLQINRHIEDMIFGPHYWRKSDTFSQIMNYYYNGLNFFDHGIYYNQLDSNGKAVAEFPLIYWLIAAQLKIFGNHLIIIRLNWIIILFSGLFSLYKIANHYIKHAGFSLLVAVALFLSPVFSFYCIAFLPDLLAINFIFIGLWFLLKSTINTRLFYLVLAIVFLSIGGMIKPFFLIPYLAFLCTLTLNQIIFKKSQFKWSYVLPLIAVAVWFIYMHFYNQSVGSDYFLSTTKPVWDATKGNMSNTWEAITTLWFKDYINPTLFWTLIVMMTSNIIWWKKSFISVNIYYIFSVLGSFVFVLLFFNMLHFHDYYIFPVLFLIPLTIAVFFYKLSLSVTSKIIKSITSFALLNIVFFGLNYTWIIIENRRKVPLLNALHLFENYNDLGHFLTKNNVGTDEYVITFSDKCPSYALSLIKRKGWSGFQTKPNNLTIPNLIDLGANFLIFNANAPFSYHDSIILYQFIDYPIDDTNNIYIYDLKPYKIND